MTRAKIVDRVRKLLARTVDRGATEPEMQASVALAERLMLRHRISRLDVEAEAGDGRRFLRLAGPYRREPAEWSQIGAVLEAGFCVRVMVRRPAGGAGLPVELVAFGAPTDLAVARHLTIYLMRSYRRLWRRARRWVPPGADRGRPPLRRSYYTGLTAGLLGRIRSERDDATRGDPSIATALVRSERSLSHALAERARVEPGPRRPGGVDGATFLAGLRDSQQLALRPAIERTP